MPLRPTALLLGPSGQVLAGILALTIVSSAAIAGVLVSYNTGSSSSFTLKAPPVVWAAGPDSSGNDYVASWSLSPNATWYSLTLKPVPEANVTWENLTIMSNADASARSVTITATSVSAYTEILDFRLEFYGYGNDTLMGGLDLRTASPESAAIHMPAGASYYTRAYIKLDDGTGQEDLPSSVDVTLSYQ